jgi:hypothetical protein
MESISRCPAKEGEIRREDRAFGHYNDSFKLYFLKKIEIYQYPDGPIKVKFKNSIDQEGFDVLKYDVFLNNNQNPKDRFFTKEELITDFFTKINEIESATRIESLSRSAFWDLGRKEMSEFFVNNWKKNQETWPTTIQIINDVDNINKNFETNKIVKIKTADIIRGDFEFSFSK